MECPTCHAIKLSNEFIQEPTLHDHNDDNFLYFNCLRCAEKDEQHPNMQQQAIEKLNKLFDLKSRNLKHHHSDSTLVFEESGDDNGILHVLSLEGEKYDIQFTNSMTVYELKINLQQIVLVPVNRISLNFNNQEMEGGRTLGSYNIRNGSNIYLMLLLYQIQSNIDKITFNLNWGFTTTTDYLDATCLFYDSNKQYIGLIDYKNFRFDNFQHSGDKLVGMTGNHIIKANLSLTKSQYIFFVLSAFHAPTIASFTSPGFNFYDDSNPNEPLSQYNISQASNHQAVILSVVYRNRVLGGWNVASLGKFSNGNAKDYTSIKQTIQTILDKPNF